MAYLPDEIWLLILKKLKFIGVFTCSLLSKRFCCLSRSERDFVDCMRVSKFVFGFDPDYFDFLSDEIKELGKTVRKKIEKDIKERSFVFSIVETILKDVVFELLPFRIYNHLFFRLKGNRMIGKCKLCSRIFIKDMDRARKIEN